MTPDGGSGSLGCLYYVSRWAVFGYPLVCLTAQRNNFMADQSHTDEDSVAGATRDRILHEGHLITDAGVSISTYFVSLESAPELNWPYGLPLIAKGSSSRNAITNRGTVRLSKPEKFREQGETLISDPNEGIARREAVQVDDVFDLERAAGVDDEIRRGASALQVEQERRTNFMSASDETTRVYGKNCWIWCAAVAPQTDADRDSWMQSLGDDYDCVRTIGSPRRFARALAVAAAEQLGARGSPIEFRHPYGGGTTEHLSQYVFHGPVAYVDDPYEYVAQGASDFQRTLRAAFFKHTSHASQCEYRFVIWADVEPDELVVDLVATPDILAEIQPATGDGCSEDGAVGRQASTATHRVSAVSAAAAAPVVADEADPVRVPVDFASDLLPVSMPMRAESSETQTTSTSRNIRLVHHEQIPARKAVQVSSSLQTVTVQTSRYALRGNHEFSSELGLLSGARNARAHALHYMIHNLVNESDFTTDSAAALFHAERVANRLLLMFVDPIERIRWSESEVVLDIKMPAESRAEVSIAIGPRGAAQYKITHDDGYEHVVCENVLVATEIFAEDLHELGLQACESAVKAKQVPMLPSIVLPSKERPDAVIKHTAQLHRRTSKEVSDINEAEIDTANAEIEPCPSDARITKLVVDSGPGAVLEAYGIRDGLAGTYRHLARRDHVKIHVQTMNPSATVKIDPPDSAPEQEGHVVALPDDEDSAITITATSPDGTAQSMIKLIAEGTGASETAD